MSTKQQKSVTNFKAQPLHQTKKDSAFKINPQLVWKMILLFVSIFSSILFNQIYAYQTKQSIASIRKGNVWQLVGYGTLFGLAFIYFETLFHKHLIDRCDKYYLSYQRCVTKEARQKRCYTLVRWSYNIIFYASTSSSCYFILRGTSFLPTWMGGNGTCTDVTRYMNSFEEATIAMKVLYIVEFGKQMARFFQHLFIRAQGNFYEFALHHGLSSFLIFFSYLMNMWMIGIFVLMIHDVSDLFLSLSRAYKDYKNKSKYMLKFMYFLGGFMWISMRIFIFSYCCVYSSMASAWKLYSQKQLFSQDIYDLILMPGIFMAFMLFCLEIMHIFWTYYILSAFIEVNVSEKIAKQTYF